jgi:hypothetical protein
MSHPSQRHLMQIAFGGGENFKPTWKQNNERMLQFSIMFANVLSTGDR